MRGPRGCGHPRSDGPGLEREGRPADARRLIFTALPGGSFNFDGVIDLSNGWLDCTHDARGQHRAGLCAGHSQQISETVEPETKDVNYGIYQNH